MVLCWWGGLRLAQALRGSAARSPRQAISIIGLTLALLMWLVAFLTVGGEWFLMWQSKTWNGQEAALRNVHGDRHRVAAGGAAGYGRATLIFRLVAIFAVGCVDQEPEHSGSEIYEINVGQLAVRAFGDRIEIADEREQHREASERERICARGMNAPWLRK